MILAAIMIMAQVIPDSAQPAPPPLEAAIVEQQIKEIARRTAKTTNYLESAIFDDPAMRKEVLRVGFRQGCQLVSQTSQAVVQRQLPHLEPLFIVATRKVVPTQRLVFPAVRNSMMFGGRITFEVEQAKGPALLQANEDMRLTFLAMSQKLPRTRDPKANRIMPKSDLARALGVVGPWKLSDPSQLAMACIETQISPEQRPTISTDGKQ